MIRVLACLGHAHQWIHRLCTGSLVVERRSSRLNLNWVKGFFLSLVFAFGLGRTLVATGVKSVVRLKIWINVPNSMGGVLSWGAPNQGGQCKSQPPETQQMQLDKPGQ